VGEVNLVIGIIEFDLEGQRIQLLVHTVCLFAFAWVVLDVEAAAMPALQRIFGLLLRVEQWAHPVVVQGVGLVKVSQVELVDLALAGVRNAEVKPLGELLGRAVVELHLQVVLEIGNLDCLAQVARLKARFKDQSWVLCVFRAVKAGQFIEII